MAESYHTTLDIFYPVFCLIVSKGDCWALVEVCTLLSALLVNNSFRHAAAAVTSLGQNHTLTHTHTHTHTHLSGCVRLHGAVFVNVPQNNEALLVADQKL